MEMGPDFYKIIIGKIKKIIKKRTLLEGKFHTPGCVRELIPARTVYYEIILVEGAEWKPRYYGNKAVIKKGIKLKYFEYPPKKTHGENLIIGNKYQFYVSGETWVSAWEEIKD